MNSKDNSLDSKIENILRFIPTLDNNNQPFLVPMSYTNAIISEMLKHTQSYTNKAISDVLDRLTKELFYPGVIDLNGNRVKDAIQQERNKLKEASNE